MKKFILFSVIFIFLASVGWGQVEFTWTGGGDITDWEDLNNWAVYDPDGIILSGFPGDSRNDDIVIIEDDILGVQFSNDITIKELTVNDDKNVIINANNNDFTVTDTINFDGSITIISGGGNISVKDINGTGSIEIDAGSGDINVNGDITTAGNQTYTGTINFTGTNSLNSSAGNITITETTGRLDVNNILSGVNVNLKAKTDIVTKVITVSGIVSLEADGNITVSGNISANQLLATAAGDVNVGAFNIHTAHTGHENTDAAIYIKADNFAVAPSADIIPGGSGGQLCLDLNHHWDDTNSVVDGNENVRWHQHYLNLTGKDLVYGDGTPAGLPSGTYVYIYDNDFNNMTFTLDVNKNIYIINAKNTNPSGISFQTSGSGFIEFIGTNKFEKITLESANGIHLADTEITVTNGFVLTHGEEIKLTANSPSGAGSEIKAANITLNNITTTLGKDLTLTSTTGNITSGNIGFTGAYLGDVTVHSAGIVTFSGAIYANSLGVTSTGTTISADITTTAAQTYTGAVTLGGVAGVRTLKGTTVTLGAVTGNSHPLTIDGNGVLHGGSGISVLSVSLNTTINANITTATTQTYTGAVTLGGDVVLTGSTVTLGVITGNNHSLTINGNGVLHGGSGINVLTAAGNFNLASGGSLNATEVDFNGTSHNIASDINTTGDQNYTGAVTLDGAKRIITSNNGDIVFFNTLDVTDKEHDIIELIATGGNITVSGKIEAYRLIAKAKGTVSVNEIKIDSSNTENDGLNAAIYIEAYTFNVTSTTNSIIPGGQGSQWGQLCLVLNVSWTGPYDVVDGPQDMDPDLLTATGYRWHQHIFDLTGKHLVYGDGSEPPGYNTTDYFKISNNNIKTIFILDPNCHVYIYGAVNTTNNSTGLSFKTGGTGFIEFIGTNIINNLTLDSGNGIRLVDANITVNSGFEINNNEEIILDSLSGAGSSIKAAEINLKNITARNNENLTLTSTSGEIIFNGTVGTTGKYIGGITVNSADKVTFLEDLYANSLVVTSTDITISANITTTAAQTYTGPVTLGGSGATRILTGTTVTLGTITGGGNSLTITGNGVLSDGSGIVNLSVSGTTVINASISATGTQAYSTTGAVTLGGDLTLTGSTVTLGPVTGNGKSLAITGNGTLNGASGINILTVSGTTAVNQDISTTGDQNYTGAVTLGGSGKRTMTSNNGSIEFMSTLNSTDKIELSAANGDISISGSTTAGQLIARAPNGTVSVNAVTINSSNTGNEGENAAIYIVADTFVVTVAPSPPYSIIPGGRPVGGAQWGQLCLVVKNEWTDTNDVVDGPEEDDHDNLHTTGFRWHQHRPILDILGKILYSFTEDSSGNGRLDRIRVQTSVELFGDFTGFDVSVTGYEIDKSKGTITNGLGFDLVSTLTGKTPFDKDSFYIYLKEKSEIDGENTPLWSITKNTSLTNKAGSIVGDPAVDKNIKPIDTIPPRITYTLTIPGHPQTFVQMSEPAASSFGGDISASFGGLSVQGISKIDPAGLRFLFNLSGSLKTEDLAKNIDSSTLDNGYFQIDAVDLGQRAADLNAVDPGLKPPKYPLNWGYTEYAKVYDNGTVENADNSAALNDVFIPPNKILTADMMRKLANNQGNLVTPNKDPVIRRVTDVLVSRTPEKTDSENYFAWPVWARFKKSLNAPYSAGNDVFWGQQPTDTGIIWQFDGSNFLETSFINTNDGIEIQARINDNLSEAPVLFWTAADIPVEYRNPKEATEAKKTGGLWLPNALAPLYNYVPLSDGINGKTADSSSSKLYNYDVAANILSVGSSAKFEFIFRLSNTSDMFIARLDIPRGAVIPANWYNYIRPFIFEIRNIRRQRGGVTIMNNVINSNNRETAFIRYHLVRPGRVTVQIYTLDGTLVKSLRRNEQRDAGEWTDSWDGTNNGGRAVARGMYFVRVVGPDIDEIRKIMVVK